MYQKMIEHKIMSRDFWCHGARNIKGLIILGNIIAMFNYGVIHGAHQYLVRASMVFIYLFLSKSTVQKQAFHFRLNFSVISKRPARYL